MYQAMFDVPDPLVVSMKLMYDNIPDHIDDGPPKFLAVGTQASAFSVDPLFCSAALLFLSNRPLLHALFPFNFIFISA
jgi:hypothetical protein